MNIDTVLDELTYRPVSHEVTYLCPAILERIDDDPDGLAFAFATLLAEVYPNIEELEGLNDEPC